VNEGQNVNLVLVLKHSVEHPIAVEDEEFADAGIVLFGNYAAAFGKLA